MYPIDRFIDAQEGNEDYPSYKKAYDEIALGRKDGHWIWYVLPQITGLGSTSTSKEYAISNLQEACEYLQNEVLFNNYYNLISLICTQLETIPVEFLMGGDAIKLASSITLFRAAAYSLIDQGDTTHDYPGLILCCDTIFDLIAQQGYPHCETTLKKLKQPSHSIAKSSFFQETSKKEIGHAPPKKEVIYSTPLSEKVITASLQEHHVTEEHSPEIVKKPTGVETIVEIPASVNDFAKLSKNLGEYIGDREKEWGFHYNFLGILSIIYWLQDKFTGSDHFNDKHREIKISAATKLKELIDGHSDSLTLEEAEENALSEGRLGNMVEPYGGWEHIKQSKEKPSSRTIDYL